MVVQEGDNTLTFTIESFKFDMRHADTESIRKSLKQNLSTKYNNSTVYKFNLKLVNVVNLYFKRKHERMVNKVLGKFQYITINSNQYST